MKQKWTNLSCFNPFVMASTFVIEIGLLLYLLVKLKRKNMTVTIVMFILFFLAAFQGAEYMLCQTNSFGEMWARIGFVVITMLPPLGLHLASTISKTKNIWAKILVPLAYLNAVVWVVIFGFGMEAFDNYGCAPNYAIFDLDDMYAGYYQTYYYGWLFIAMLMSYYLARVSKVKSAKIKLSWLMIGYMTFIVPTIGFQYLQPNLSFAIPSVMCGFAIMLALILVFAIVQPHKKQK